MARQLSGERITDQAGTQWRATQGGHYRNDLTGQLYGGQGRPGAAPGGPAAPRTFQPQPVNLQGYGQNLPGLGGAQQALNFSQLGLNNLYNRVNQQGPYGSVNFSQNPSTGAITQSTMGLPGQDIIRQQQEERNRNLGERSKISFGQLSKQLQNPFSLKNIAPAGMLPSTGDIAGERRRIEEQSYQGYANRLLPQYKQEREQLMQQLADQGIPRGSQAESQALASLDQRQKDSLIQAQTAAGEFAGGEQQRMFGQGESLFNLSNQLRQQGIGEKQLMRQVPFTEFANLSGMQQGPQYMQPYQPYQLGMPGLDYFGGGVGLQQAQIGAGAQIEAAKLAAEAAKNRSDTQLSDFNF